MIGFQDRLNLVHDSFEFSGHVSPYLCPVYHLNTMLARPAHLRQDGRIGIGFKLSLGFGRGFLFTRVPRSERQLQLAFVRQMFVL